MTGWYLFAATYFLGFINARGILAEDHRPGDLWFVTIVTAAFWGPIAAGAILVLGPMVLWRIAARHLTRPSRRA